MAWDELQPAAAQAGTPTFRTEFMEPLSSGLGHLSGLVGEGLETTINNQPRERDSPPQEAPGLQSDSK